MYWVRMQDMKKSMMHQKLVLGMARHFTKVAVGGVIAMDKDKDCGVQAIMYASSMLEGQGDREVVCRGKVLLHMSDTV